MSNTMGAGEVAESIRAMGTIPSIDEVHAQGFDFYPRHWLDRWPRDNYAIPPVLSLDGLDDRGRRYLNRSDLFRLGQDVQTPTDALNFFVAVYAWGVGNKARGVGRGVRVLEDGMASDRIFAALTALRESHFDPRTGYEAFHFKAQSRLKYLGPAFFTKLLYFYSHDRAISSTNLPLILDQRVAHSVGIRSTSWWTPDEYADYIDLIDRVRINLDSDVPCDVIEYLLFQAG